MNVRLYHGGMSSETWHHRCIYKIPEINMAILRPTSYMCIRVGEAAIKFVRLTQNDRTLKKKSNRVGEHIDSKHSIIRKYY